MHQGHSPLCRNFIVFFLSLALFLFLAATCLAADAPSGKEIPLRVKNVEIKKVKVRLPIPDGYEEMQREDHPERYDWMVEAVAGDDMLPLAFFINSEDKANLKRGEKVNLRYGFAFSDKSFWDAVIFGNTIEQDRAYFEKYINFLSEGEELYDYQIIYNALKSISFSCISKEKIPNEPFKKARTESYVILDHKVVAMCLYKKAYTTDDIEELTRMTVSYLEKIDQGQF